MRVVLFLRSGLAVLLWALGAPSAQAGDPAGEFEKLVQTATAATQALEPIYQNARTGKWLRRGFVLSEVKYDVRKTDSLITPILGIASFRLSAETSDAFDTKEAAEKAEINPISRRSYTVALNYSYKDDKWNFKDGEYESSFTRGTKFPVSEQSILKEPFAIPLVVIRYWVPSISTK